MPDVGYERLQTAHVPRIWPQMSLTPVIERDGSFSRVIYVYVKWHDGDGVQKFVPFEDVAKQQKEVDELEDHINDLIEDDDRLRELAERLWLIVSSGGCNKKQLAWLDYRCEELGLERPSDVARELGIGVDQCQECLPSS